MKPIRTKEQLPTECINIGDIEVWWYNQESFSWTLGHAMLLDFEGDSGLFNKYTYWLPVSALPIPKEVDEEEEDISIT